MSKELLVAIITLVVILAGCGIQQSLDEGKPVVPINLDDAGLYRDSSDGFEPYDGR